MDMIEYDEQRVALRFALRILQKTVVRASSWQRHTNKFYGDPSNVNESLMSTTSYGCVSSFLLLRTYSRNESGDAKNDW